MKKRAKLAYVIFGCALGYMVFFSLSNFSTQDTTHLDHGPISEMNSGHMKHELINIENTEIIPSVSAVIIPDTMGGYNIQLITENFLFTPEKIGDEPVTNQGHAHLYINGEKISRIYSQWYYLDEHHLLPGENTIRITLNSNNHNQWSIKGVPIEFTTIINYTQ